MAKLPKIKIKRSDKQIRAFNKKLAQWAAIMEATPNVGLTFRATGGRTEVENIIIARTHSKLRPIKVPTFTRDVNGATYFVIGHTRVPVRAGITRTTAGEKRKIGRVTDFKRLQLAAKKTASATKALLEAVGAEWVKLYKKKISSRLTQDTGQLLASVDYNVRMPKK